MAVIKDKKCMIIGAAPLASGAVFEEFDPKEHYVICADAGYDTAVQYGVRPDLVIGDFDSAAKRDSKPPARNGRQKRYRKIIRNQMMHLRIYWNDPVRELR